jgi:hypothetical protein
MKFNRDFLLGALAAAILIVPLAVGLAAAQAQDSNSTPASSMQMTSANGDVTAQLRNHWQAMLEQHQQLAEARDSADARLSELINEVETADSDQQKLAATANLVVALARQDIDRERTGQYGVNDMLSQMALMGRMQGWMSDDMYQNSMMMMQGGDQHSGMMGSGMMNYDDEEDDGGHGGGMHSGGMGGMHH